mmetsp:Transcript_21045/g.27378  ORF Transcript_21045/g.27378 Transcript_21045/m.27378 type:complete len:446 (+) Transcript_21045:552-1889(+)
MSVIRRIVEPKGNPPASRFGYVSVVHGSRFILFGGYDGTAWLNDTHEYDFDTELWKSVETKGQIPSIRSCPSWCKEGNKVFVFGGYDGVRRMNDFFCCDLDTDTWHQLPCGGAPQDIPSPRYFHACTMYSGKMYTFGGFNGSERLNDMYEYNFETLCWKALHKDCSLPNHNSSTLNSMRSTLLPNNLSHPQPPPIPNNNHRDGDRTTDERSWRTNNDSRSPPLDVPSGRSSLVSQVYKNSLFVFGGYNGAVVLNDFFEFRFDPTSTQPKSCLIDDLRSLINNQALSDVTFIVEGQQVFASRIHLASRSEHFRAMLYGGMKESYSSDEGIEIEDVSHEVFLKILEFLYTDEVKDIPSELAVPLLMASERFLLTRLKALCETAIRLTVTPENVVGTLLAAHMHHATSLKAMALDFLLDNIDLVKASPSFAELKTEPDLLLEILMRSA